MTKTAKDVSGFQLEVGDYIVYSASSGNYHSLSFGRIKSFLKPTKEGNPGIRFFSVNNWYGQGRYFGNKSSGFTRKLNNVLRVERSKVPQEVRDMLDKHFED